ncbi:hypothetical protein KC19_12G137000 [Ceratodon purpureus]|uniref:Secreted protein n=1 Tax=Ceratodon purpureus TaxID=3225 RepID=A0A8T0GCP8_CERPU|nr:hypothetical protein KC19_12G137000 [Ceratodon purpureus]
MVDLLLSSYSLLSPLVLACLLRFQAMPLRSGHADKHNTTQNYATQTQHNTVSLSDRCFWNLGDEI